jgi:hypothetical protein
MDFLNGARNALLEAEQALTAQPYLRVTLHATYANLMLICGEHDAGVAIRGAEQSIHLQETWTEWAARWFGVNVDENGWRTYILSVPSNLGTDRNLVGIATIRENARFCEQA